MIGREEVRAITEAVQENGGFTWTIGKRGARMEAELSKLTGVENVVLTNSGSSALLLALLALNLPRGSRVMLPATLFPTALSAVKYAGLSPVVIDSDPKTLCINDEELEEALEELPNVAAVIVVNIAGSMPFYPNILKLQRKYKFKLIIDNCDGFGGTHKGRFIESFADVATTSFHAAHILSMGEGGAVFAKDKAVAKRARMFRDWGREGGDDKPTAIKELPRDYPQRYSYPVLGFNLKPLELQAAVGLVQIKKLDTFFEIRKRNFEALLETFSVSSFFRGVCVYFENEPCWFSFPVICRTEGIRTNAVKFLESKNIETRPIFAGNIMKHPASEGSIAFSSLSGAEEIMRRAFFVGLSPRTTPEMLRYIERCVKEFIKKYA